MLPIISKNMSLDIFHKNGLDEEIRNENHKNVSYSVSTATKEATEVAENILKQGGNAVDASIALSFALGVTLQQNGPIGGGGVLLVYDPISETAFYYDYYPSSGYEKSNFDIGIPGFFKGMEAIYEDFASLNLNDLINPSINLARNGVAINPEIAELIYNSPFIAELNPNFIVNGKLASVGSVIKQENLALLYEDIIENGFNLMYDGVSDLSTNLMEISGLSKKSLADYKVYKREALSTKYLDSIVFGTNAPFSGLTSLQTLKMYQDVNSLDLLNIDDKTLSLYESINTEVFTTSVRKIADNDNLRNEAMSIDKVHIIV